MDRKTMDEKFSPMCKRAGSVERFYTRKLEQCMSEKYIPGLDNDGVIFRF